MSTEYYHYGIWNKKEDLVALLAQGVEKSESHEHTLVYIDKKKKGWPLDKYLPWNSSSINTDINGNIIVIGIDGKFAVKTGDSYVEDLIDDYPTVTSSYRADDFLYIAGLSSCLYKCSKDLKWQLDNNGIKPDEDLSSIHGNSYIMYVVGFNGICYSRKKNIWQEEPLPTNENLKSVFVDNNNKTFIVGQNGTLLIGNDGVWDSVIHDYTLDYFWSVKKFEENIYIAGNNIIYILNWDGEWKITPVYGWDIDKNGTFSDIFCENGKRTRLWVMSEKGLSYLQDGEWTML